MPRVRFIVAHSGGALPYLADRMGLWVLPDNKDTTAEAAADGLRSLYYETAQSFSPGTLACLQQVTEDSHILFGTDYPMLGETVIAATQRAVSGYGEINAAAVGRESVLALFPRLRAQFQASSTHVGS